jgi:hypothetical protein
MRCHACGHRLDVAGSERIGFAEVCEACSADLHCCANCAHHDASAYNECREPGAERVSDRERANRCEYFRPGDPGADGTREDARERARASLDALFRK